MSIKYKFNIFVGQNMNILELQDKLTNLNINIPDADICKIWGMDTSSFSRKKKFGSEIKYKNIEQLERALNIQLIDRNISATELKNRAKKMYDEMGLGDKETVQILYGPDVHFSAGYGIEVLNEQSKEYITLDEKLFRTDRGTKIDPKNCELLTVSGNSMSPKWEDGDRFILDKSVNEFIDGQTFAFKLNGECYIKEICLLGKRAKAIPINKEYDEFYIEPEDELVIFGRVVPRIRL